jgi:hypothetical protein
VSSILRWPDDVMDIGADVEGGGDEGGEGGDEVGDGFFTTVAYLRISFDKDNFIIGIRFVVGV